MIGKAGDLMRKYPITSTTLGGGGSILGLIWALKSLSKPEQDAVLDAAAAEEEGSDATAYGLSSGSLLGAAAILAVMDQDEDL